MKPKQTMRKVAPAMLCALVAVLGTAKARCQDVTLPDGTAFRVKLAHRVRIRIGAPVTGQLTEPVYLVDREVIPAGAIVSGTITATKPDARKEHIRRVLGGDFTPPRVPVIVFHSVTIPAQGERPARTIFINAPAEQTTARVLTLGAAAKKRSLMKQAEDALIEEKKTAEGTLKQARHPVDTLKHYPYVETVERWALGQVPLHPQIIWSDARFNADLAHPVAVPGTSEPHPPIEDLHGRLPQGVLHARLITSLSSATAKRGDPVTAIITQPVFSSDQSKLLVPEGTHLYGKVMYAKPARRFGRNGSLRFSFNRLDLPTTETRKVLEIHGQISAAETAPGEHVRMDEEGQVQASDGPAKFAEPLLLLALAAHAAPDDDHHAATSADTGTATTSSNGFGLIARVVALSTRNTNVIQGFAYYALAKSVYYHFIDKGHETTFPHDTEVQVTLSER